MLQKAEIVSLLTALNKELNRSCVCGELYLVGGAVMTLVFDARDSTKDIDTFFRPAEAIRQAAARVAAHRGCDPDWINDAVKGYMNEHGSFADYLDLSNLKVMTAQPEYLLAMKCLSMRLGPEFHDEDDVRFLLRYLNLTRYQQAVNIISRYYPLDRIPAKALSAMEEILGGS